MFSPTVQQVLELAKTYNLIPVVRDLFADTETPIRVFQQFYNEERAFLLESVEGGVKWARYSFIGKDPFLLIRGKNNRTEVEVGGKRSFSEHNPMEVLKAHIRAYRSPQIEGMPRFTGGAVGFFGYDLLQYYEKIPAHPVDDLEMDDLQFMFCDQVIAFDHFKQQIKVIANVHVGQHDTEEQIIAAYDRVCGKIDETIDRLQHSDVVPAPAVCSVPIDVELGEVRSNMTRPRYEQMVEQAKEYIRAGDIFQVVLSQRFEMDTEVSPLHVYRVLRTLNPSPYMYCLKMDDDVIVGASPEMLVRVEDSKVETSPIAGTRPRGENLEADDQLAQELLLDEKERAEHLMLVDLGRNDLGRVSEFGTVKCDTFMEIERYSHVMHIVSNVSGKLRQDKDFFDAFISCLPAGTLSGAPKLRAMEIISEMEKEARGAYGGAIGYLGFSGNMDSCITIRTIVFKKGKAYVQAGAGIVGDSVPQTEFEETANKAKALLTAIRAAELMFPAEQKKTPVFTNPDYL